MDRRKAAEIVGYSRRRGKAIGCMIWPAMIVVGIGGTIYWKWYALPIALLAGFAFGSIYSVMETKRIERITGLNIHDQERAYRESLAAALDPVTSDPKKYKEYIESMEEPEEEVEHSTLEKATSAQICEHCGSSDLEYDDYWSEFMCEKCGWIKK